MEAVFLQPFAAHTFKPQFVKYLPPTNVFSDKRRGQRVTSKKELERVAAAHGLNVHWR